MKQFNMYVYIFEIAGCPSSKVIVVAQPNTCKTNADCAKLRCSGEEEPFCENSVCVCGPPQHHSRKWFMTNPN